MSALFALHLMRSWYSVVACNLHLRVYNFENAVDDDDDNAAI